MSQIIIASHKGVHADPHLPRCHTVMNLARAPRPYFSKVPVLKFSTNTSLVFKRRRRMSSQGNRPRSKASTLWNSAAVLSLWQGVVYRQ